MQAFQWVDLGIGVVGSVIASFLVAILVVVKHNGISPAIEAFRAWWRLRKILGSIRMIRFIRCRGDYRRLRPNADTIDRYIAQARHQLKIVSINLVTGIQIDGLCRTLEILLKRPSPVEVHISLLDPMNLNLMEALAPALDMSAAELSATGSAALVRLTAFREHLPAEVRGYLHLYRHRVLPFGSAILIDPHEKHGTVQIETKCYKAPLADSWGFELKAGGSHSLYKTLVESYEKLIKDAIPLDLGKTLHAQALVSSLEIKPAILELGPAGENLKHPPSDT